MHSEDPRNGFLTIRHHFTAPTPSRKSAGYGHFVCGNDERAGMEGCGPSQPLPAVNQHHFAVPTERTPSRESAGNGHSFFRIQNGNAEPRTVNA
jgi:hypothetical protein